jgi:hypothetical protein
MRRPFMPTMRSHARHTGLRCQYHHKRQINRIDQEALAGVRPKAVEQFRSRPGDVDGNSRKNGLEDCKWDRRQQQGWDVLKKRVWRR